MATPAYDLLIVLDATASMGAFINALNKSLPEIISLSALTDCFGRIGVVAYRDYCGDELTEWSGWCSPSGIVQGPDIVSQDHVLEMAAGIRASSGGDWPEAAKTGLARGYQEMREDATTIILAYSDAPPHFQATASRNYNREKEALKERGSYGGTGHCFVDWVSAAKTLRNGPKKGIVFSIVARGDLGNWTSWLFLSAMSTGYCFCLKDTESEMISKLTIGILLTWMGAGSALAKLKHKLATMKWYKDSCKVTNVVNEMDRNAKNYFRTGFGRKGNDTIEGNICSEEIKLKNLPSSMHNRGPVLENFAKRYASDEAFKKLVVDQLRRIISSNVSAISLNPIFGGLWRAVCNDRKNPERDSLITLFGSEVNRISDDNEKARMKAWLEESYNYAAEIEELTTSVPDEERYPLLFLDPTNYFAPDEGGSNDEDNDHPGEFTRGELLEIGRSCDPVILRRLGKVLTRLTLVEKAEDLPGHIWRANRRARKEVVPLIPVALAGPKYERKFWKVLLHAVLPGTILGARAGAVLAALALRMGVAPLRDVADQELLAFRDKWNRIDIPETWNMGCLLLLLDADRDYEKRVADGVTKRATPETSILLEGDRKLFKTLVDYKMLEANLETTLQARVSWIPEKTKVALGPVVVCRDCKFPRSVTMMGANGRCGMCAMRYEQCQCHACTPLDHPERLKNNVSLEDGEKTLGFWVECREKACQAQYVVYNPSALRVPAKCFYCRHGERRNKSMGSAPVVECSKCLSRVIWPAAYRPKGLDLTKFECPACNTNVVTIISRETTPHALKQENGKEWLLRNDDQAITQPFEGRSIFYTATHCDLANLSKKVEVLPTTDQKLTIGGKIIQNLPDVKAELSRWVLSRQSESQACSLCFSQFRKANLRRACGRKGCHQHICDECMKSWYGLNQRGRMINVAALNCPFCRRLPSPKIGNNFEFSRIGNLRRAVEEANAWIYAWCSACGFAKPYIERACEGAAAPFLRRWACEECQGPEADLTKHKLCPGCGVLTEKMGGCDHITCPCGTHWCYACGEEPGEEGIYPHIERVHGGINYGGDESEDEYDEEYGEEYNEGNNEEHHGEHTGENDEDGDIAQFRY